MVQPQAGIVPNPSPNALFLVLRVRNAATNGKAVAKVAASVPALTAKVGEIDPRAKLVCTVSFGSQFWDVHFATETTSRTASLQSYQQWQPQCAKHWR